MKNYFTRFLLIVAVVVFVCVCTTACKNDNGLGNGVFGNDPEYDYGFEYVLSSDGNYYILANVGRCTDANIVIPSKHDGKPVRVIGRAAFQNCDFLQSVTISSGIVTIEFAAFENCTGLKELSVPNTVEEIYGNAFNNCGKDIFTIENYHVYVGNKSNPYYALVSMEPSGKETSSNGYYEYNVYPMTCSPHNDTVLIAVDALRKGTDTRNLHLGESVKYITYGALLSNYVEHIYVAQKNYNYLTIGNVLYSRDRQTLIQYFTVYNTNNSETEFQVFDFVTNLAPGAFYDARRLETVILPEGMVEISPSAFAGCYNLEQIVIPKSMKKISLCAFYGASTYMKILYCGTAEEFDAMEIDDFNDPFLESYVYFYSEGKPLERGNFWHYSKDGKPVIWD